MNDLRSSVSSHIQRAISKAMNEQVLPLIQATLRSGQGQVPDRRKESRLKDRNIDTKEP